MYVGVWWPELKVPLTKASSFPKCLVNATVPYVPYLTTYTCAVHYGAEELS